MSRLTLAVGLLATLLASPGVAQVGTPQDSLKDLQALRVDVTLANNPGAARRGVDADYIRDTVERRLEQLDVELSQGAQNEDGTYLSVEVNPARVSDGFAVSVRTQLFQPATLANGETVMAATWRAESLGVRDAETLQDYVRLVLQNHAEMLGADYRAANEQ